MAEQKKSFVLYCDLIHTVNHLPDEAAGQLFKHILAYVNDEKPISPHIMVNLAFEPVKQQLKRDLSKWDEIKAKRSEAGKASAEARKVNQQNSTNSTSVESVQQTSTNSTVNDNVNVTVNVNDNVIKKEISKGGVAPVFPFRNSLIVYGFKSSLVDDWLRVRKNKKLTNTETAYKKFIAQVEKCGQDKNIILQTCVEKSWGGFESEWMIKVHPMLNGNSQSVCVTNGMVY